MRRLRAYRRHESLLTTSSTTSITKAKPSSLPFVSPPAPKIISNAAPTEAAPTTRRISSADDRCLEAYRPKAWKIAIQATLPTIVSIHPAVPSDRETAISSSMPVASSTTLRQKMSLAMCPATSMR